MTVNVGRTPSLRARRSSGGRHRLQVSYRTRAHTLITSVGRDSLYRNSLLLMVNYIAAAGLGFVYWVVASHFFPPAAVGVVSALIAAVQLCATMATLGLPNTLIRFHASDRGRSTMLRLVYLLVTATATFAGLLVCAVPGHLGVPLDSPARSDVLLPVFVIAVAASALGMLSDAAIVANRATQQILAKNLGASALKLITLPAFAGLGTIGLFTSTMIGLSAATIAGAYCAFRSARTSPQSSWRVARRTLRSRVSFSMNNHVAVVASMLPTTLLPTVAIVRLGAATGAYLAIPLLILGILNAIPGMTAQSLFAEVSVDARNVRRHVMRAIRWIYLLVVPVIGLLCICAPIVLRIFGAGYAAEGTNCLRLMAAAGLFASFNYVADVALNCLGKLQAYTLVNVGGSLVLLMACLVMSDKGLTWIGVGWLAGQAGYAVLAGSALWSINRRTCRLAVS